MDQIILITGALGYLGSRVASAINISGRQVILGVSHKNIAIIPKELNQLEIRRYDFSSIESCINLCKGVDIVIHTSGLNSEDCFKSPSNAIIVNSLYTANLLEGIKYNQVSKFLYFSTAHVYLSEMNGFINESTLPQNMHPYATSHLSAEKLINWFGLQNKTATIILRLSNCFGREIVKNSNCWNLFINDICKQAITNKIIKINSNPTTQRNFLPISELSDIILFLIKTKFITNQIVNVANTQSMTLEGAVAFVNNRINNLFNYIPEIQFAYKGNEVAKELDYSVNTLINLGYTYSNKMEFEVDELIKYIHNKLSND
jgi:UDP-glucose 4-epimerase